MLKDKRDRIFLLFYICKWSQQNNNQFNYKEKSLHICRNNNQLSYGIFLLRKKIYSKWSQVYSVFQTDMSQSVTVTENQVVYIHKKFWAIYQMRFSKHLSTFKRSEKSPFSKQTYSVLHLRILWKYSLFKLRKK